LQNKIANLRVIKEKLTRGGDPKATEKLLQKGQLSARKRLSLLLDPRSFVEFDMHVTHHCNNFGMEKKEIPCDAVVTGYGKINNRLVFVYSQDYSVMGGTFGEMHGNKICKVLDKALENRAPVIGINNSGGLRLQEILGGMKLFGELFYRNTLLSGVVPQISLVLGSVAGGQAYSPGLTDFILMTKNSNMYIAGPAFVKAQLGIDASESELGSAEMHSTVSGVADFVAENEIDIMHQTRVLFDFLPSCNKEGAPVFYCSDDPSHDVPELEEIIPDNSYSPFNMFDLLIRVVDNGELFIIKENYAQNIITAFARFNGQPVGIVANQPLVMGGVINYRAAEKAARFVRFCDAFNLPVITFQDSPAYMIGPHEESNAIITRGAKLLHSYAEATVP
jgi:methylmalonyl-CoA decarboxylase subunit alpha